MRKYLHFFGYGAQERAQYYSRGMRYFVKECPRRFDEPGNFSKTGKMEPARGSTTLTGIFGAKK